MSKISNIEAAVLGMLCERPLYGYEIEKIIEERGMRNWTEIGFSSIYYVLKRLEKAGLVNSKVKPVKGKPSRKIYSVSDSGILEMKDAVRTYLSGNVRVPYPFDLGIANIHLLPKHEVVSSLYSYMDSLADRVKFLEKEVSRRRGTDESVHVVALFERPLYHIKGEMDWIIRFLEQLKKEPDWPGHKE